MRSLIEGIQKCWDLFRFNIPIIMFLVGLIVINIGLYFYIGFGVLITIGITLVIVSLVVEKTYKELEEGRK